MLNKQSKADKNASGSGVTTTGWPSLGIRVIADDPTSTSGPPIAKRLVAVGVVVCVDDFDVSVEFGKNFVELLLLAKNCVGRESAERF